MPELWKISGLQLARMIASKKIKPSEVMEAILARIDGVNPKLNAFCTVARDSAMAEARAADKKVARAKSLPPLFGVPRIHQRFDLYQRPAYYLRLQDA